jgi:uncharacterized SAM-binding protein YcdF (DUF218 family)
MIARFGSVLVLTYVLGFALFAVTLGRPLHGGDRQDAAVVLTGGSGRIEHAVAVLSKGEVERVLISGADPSVTKQDIARRVGRDRRWIACCVDLGTEAADTRGNAEEAERWLKRHHFHSVRLITSDWHMRRARYEFDLALGRRYQLVEDAIRTEPNLVTLFGEYNKYLLRRLSVWVDL